MNTEAQPVEERITWLDHHGAGSDAWWSLPEIAVRARHGWTITTLGVNVYEDADTVVLVSSTYHDPEGVPQYQRWTAILKRLIQRRVTLQPADAVPVSP